MFLTSVLDTSLMRDRFDLKFKRLEEALLSGNESSSLGDKGCDKETHRKYTKIVMKKIMPAKKRKMPHRKEHSILRYLQIRAAQSEAQSINVQDCQSSPG